MQIQRRLFLGSVGASALATSVPSQAAAAAPAGAAAGNTWDLSWADRVTAKHRAVFDSPEFSGGAGLLRAVVWKHQYKEVYGTAPEDMNAVLVLRAEGIWLAMSDAFWKDYEVGEKQGFKRRDTGAFHTANPIASAPAQAKPDAVDNTLPAFLAAGNIVLACNLAFGAVVGLVKKTDKLATDDEARRKALAGLLPGVILQPSGVFAALRAQEAGCSYILAS
jgi:hypothetical protein